MAKRPKKEENALHLIQEAIRGKAFRITRHAEDRMKERNITQDELVHVLLNGYREKKKDEYKSEFMDWNYAMRGKTLDEDKELRIAVALEQMRTEGGRSLQVITVIDLSPHNEQGEGL